MKLPRFSTVLAAALLYLTFPGFAFSNEEPKQKEKAGANEQTPSRSHYFSWINNTNQGSDETQTLANLDFFGWLNKEYGMELDIYAWDAGNVDAPSYYGGIHTERFKKHYPRGLDPIVDRAADFGCRLGIWLGPDGFGDTPEEEKRRHDMLVSLCRDYNFYLFKVDAVCGRLREEKVSSFVDAIKECRQHQQDLIILNHRLNLGAGEAYTTTRLWGGEAYIDVWRANNRAATHNRAVVTWLGVPHHRGIPIRLREDHGVCLSSCLDYWEDDLMLQAFSRNMLLAPQIYGSPWFLRDEEFPKLARIYNLCRDYRDILVNGRILPSEIYGSNAVSRGTDGTRIVTLRNPDWETVEYTATLGDELGLAGDGPFEVRLLHPYEQVLGTFQPGEQVKIPVLPFRAAMFIASNQPVRQLGVEGCAYEVVRDVEEKPAVLKLLALPGEKVQLKLASMPRTFQKATLDGTPVTELIEGKTIEVEFPGKPLAGAWHKKLGSLEKCDIPADAEPLYESTVFAANNNALEIRSIERSGPTALPTVQKARDEFFKQSLLVERGVWDKYLFDGNMESSYRLRTRQIHGGALRVDFGRPTEIDKLVLHRAAEEYRGRVFRPDFAEVSADLKTWKRIPIQAEEDVVVKQLDRDYSIDFEYVETESRRLTINLPANIGPIRYVRIPGAASSVAEIVGTLDGKPLDRSAWKATNAFAAYPAAPAQHAWQTSFTIDESARGSYLVVACIGRHGRDGAYAALRVDGKYVGAPTRASSYPANPWEYGNRRPDRGLSYFFPVTDDMIGKKIDAVVLQVPPQGDREPVELGQITPEVWMTAYPIPFESKTLVLEE